MYHDKEAFLLGYQTGRRLRLMQYRGTAENDRGRMAAPDPQGEETDENRVRSNETDEHQTEVIL